MGHRVTIGIDGDVPSEEILQSAPGFTSREEMLEATRDPRYKTDPYYRKLIERCAQNTDPKLLGLGGENEPEEDGELRAARLGAIQERFQDPKYKTSAAFRLQTRELLAQHSPSSGLGVKGTHRVEVSGRADRTADHSVFQALRIEQVPEITGSDAPGVE